MDPGLQKYGGQQFEALQEAGGKIFISLPMKKYSDEYAHNKVSAPAAAPQAASPPSPTAQETYYAGASGGCFGADSRVKVRRNGERELMKCYSSVHKIVSKIAIVHLVYKNWQVIAMKTCPLHLSGPKILSESSVWIPILSALHNMPVCSQLFTQAASGH